MDCSCDYEMPSFYNSTIRRARKLYRCDECPGEIRPREQYEFVSGKWDGYVGTYRTCERCVEIRQWVKNNVPCACFCHGNNDESMRQSVDAAYSRAGNEVVGLLFGFLRRMVTRNRFNKQRAAA
jgi:hypothetical protein